MVDELAEQPQFVFGAFSLGDVEQRADDALRGTVGPADHGAGDEEILRRSVAEDAAELEALGDKAFEELPLQAVRLRPPGRAECRI
ncbi:MAG: hypothetical protein M5R36_11040 [Deltaproteobacteria bacterium]|nr:hypothetical protein [Deltaproteobacteria bacterium]